MKPTAVFLGEHDNAARTIAGVLGAEADVHFCAHVAELLQPESVRPQLVCLFASAADAAQVTLQQLKAHKPSASASCFVFLPAASGAETVALLAAGACDIFAGTANESEIEQKLRAGIENSRLREETGILKEQIHKLSQYFSTDVVEKILSQSGEHLAYGENLEATIFFLDIRNFTTLSETVEPNLVAALLNRLYTDLMDLILTYKGSVNKIIGDALLATFGCPTRGEHDAANAVQCALAIRDTLKFFNETRPAYLKHDISIGMGIATGRVFAGTIGSYRKMEYTVIGDTVNVASRLEGLTKLTKFDLIIDSRTRDLAGENLKVRKLRVSRVRGRTQPMEIYLVDGFQSEPGNDESGAVFFSR